MRKTLRSLAAAALCALICASATQRARSAAPNSDEDSQAVRARVQLLLDRYEANDATGVIALLDPEKFLMLGSDVSARQAASGFSGRARTRFPPSEG